MDEAVFELGDQLNLPAVDNQFVSCGTDANSRIYVQI